MKNQTKAAKAPRSSARKPLSWKIKTEARKQPKSPTPQGCSYGCK